MKAAHFVQEAMAHVNAVYILHSSLLVSFHYKMDRYMAMPAEIDSQRSSINKTRLLLISLLSIQFRLAFNFGSVLSIKDRDIDTVHGRLVNSLE